MMGEIKSWNDLKRDLALWEAREALSKQIAGNIRAFRKSQHMSQETLAKLSGMKQEHIARYESFSYRGHTIKGLHQLAFSLRITVEHLVSRKDE